MDTSSDERYLTTAEAARLLDVKAATLYAYVSRGLLTSVRQPGKRGSLFAERQVRGLAERGREGRAPAGPLDRVTTRLSLLDGDELFFRGHRATDLAVSRSIEAVASLLWHGEFTDPEPFTCPESRLAAVRAATAALPGSVRLTDRLRVAVAVLAADDPFRFDLSPTAVARAGRILLAGMVGSLGPGPGGSGVAAGLWPALSPAPARPDLLGAALVLLADHDLAISTVAARVAASARANPYAVVSAGMGALDGPYHGTSSTLAHRFIADAMTDPVAALSEHLRLDHPLPGFGHLVYTAADPRADLLLSLLREVPAAAPALAAVDGVRAHLPDRDAAFPNVDLALAVLMHAHGMRPDAGEAIFAVARTVGWVAHAMEEYTQPALRFRPTGVYVGDRPD